MSEQSKISVYDCATIDLGQISLTEGNMTVVENEMFPFKVKRVFYLFDIRGGESRGAHAHKACHQFLVPASGSFEVELDDGKYKRKVFLNRPNIGLHIPPGIWASEQNFSSGAICLVLASEQYDENDYIRSYNTYLNFRNISFINFSTTSLEKTWLWLNDVEIKYLTHTPDFTIEKQAQWFTSLNGRLDYIVKAVCHQGREIGVVGLKEINKDTHTAEYFGYIGEKEYWGKGIGSSMLFFIQDLAKTKLNIKILTLKVIIDNTRAIKAYERFGFVRLHIDSNMLFMQKEI